MNKTKATMSRLEKRTVVLYYLALIIAVSSLVAGIYAKNFAFLFIPILLIVALVIMLVEGVIDFNDE